MGNRKEIIEFEDLFKEVPKENKPDYQPENNSKYSLAILTYLLIMFVLASIFYVILFTLPAFQKTYSEDELILENVTIDTQSLAVMRPYTYSLYQDRYQDYIFIIGEYDGYLILSNLNNSYAESLFYTIDELTNEDVLDHQKVISVFEDNSIIKTWDDDQLEIHFYAGKNQSLPSFYQITYQELEGPITELSDFGSAFINFAVYLALLPFLLLILKKDFINDFNRFKTQKSQWFSIVIIGYLYLMIGNVISNFTSTFIGDIFGLTPVEAINQITIIRALNSSGAVFMILSAVIMGPIAEELIFRKSIFALFRSDKWALIISSLLFGSIHLIGEENILSALVNGLSYYVMGFIFGYIYIKNKKNLFAPLAVHILSNAISIIAILFV